MSSDIPRHHAHHDSLDSLHTTATSLTLVGWVKDQRTYTPTFVRPQAFDLQLFPTRSSILPSPVTTPATPAQPTTIDVILKLMVGTLLSALIGGLVSLAVGGLGCLLLLYVHAEPYHSSLKGGQAIPLAVGGIIMGIPVALIWMTLPHACHAMSSTGTASECTIRRMRWTVIWLCVAVIGATGGAVGVIELKGRVEGMMSTIETLKASALGWGVFTGLGLFVALASSARGCIII